MKKIFYSIMALALLTACSNEDMLPDVPKEGPVQLASVSVGSMTRGSIDNGEFAFDNEDKVVMTATVNSSLVSNTFTYNGGKWSQDAPEGNYSLICVQDSPMIESIVSYGGNATTPADGGRNQNSRVSYIAADVLKADVSMGSIERTDGVVSARLAHANSDFVVKVRDGKGSANVLAEGTPVLTVTIDADGLDMGGDTYDYIAWNAGKSQDENGDWYTTFRVILPDGCTVLKATLSKANAAAGEATTEIKFYWAESHEPSVREELKHGTRYSATYEYNEYLSMTSVGISIKPFDEYAEQDITASKDWSFDETTKTYTVFTAEGLQIVNKDIAENIKTKKGYNITLAADITLSDPVAPETSNWIPLGLRDENYRFYSFNGTFDGAGYTISNLQIKEDKDYMALIGVAGKGCKVKNLTLDKPIISSGEYSYAAGIVGYYYDFDGSESIINCHIKDGSIKGSSEVGGIAGQSVGNIMACTVSGTTIDGYSLVGGITGSQYDGRIIACGVDEVNLRCSDDWFGGIAGYWSVTGLTKSPAGYMYSCYAKDCTIGTDSQALEGTTNLLGSFLIYAGYSLTANNCAFRAKNGSITYGVGGTMSGPTEILSSELFTEAGTADSDWPTASRDLNVGINEWNGFDPTFPCNWEWDTAATAEGKLKVKQ